PIASRGEAGRRFFNRRSYTTPASLAGVPALSLPCGFTAGGLPIGLQLIGRRFDEATLLPAGRAYERAAGWAGRPAPPPRFSPRRRGPLLAAGASRSAPRARPTRAG